MKKHIPNIISGARIPLSVSLMLLTQKTFLFVAVYIICGITDIMDGFIARRYKLESELGSKLDGLGDFFFFVSALISIVFVMNLRVKKSYVAYILFLAVLKTVNIIITKIKFKQWNSMHTFVSKCIGLVIFVAIPICIMLERIPGPLIGTILFIGTAAFFEETLILLTAKEYNPNRKSLFSGNNTDVSD